MPDTFVSDHFYGDEAEQFIYFRIPRQLLTNPRFKRMTTDSKLLYGMLLDRMGMSAKNGWYDNAGHIYIIPANKSVQIIGNGPDRIGNSILAFDPLPICSPIPAR